MMEPIDKGRTPLLAALARWALVFAIILLVWAVYAGFGSMNCICGRLGDIASELGAIETDIKKLDDIASKLGVIESDIGRLGDIVAKQTGGRTGRGPGGGGGTISLGSGSGGGGSMTTAWSVTEGSPAQTRAAAPGAPLRIRADALGRINIFDAQTGAGGPFSSLTRYVAKIRPSNSQEVLTLRVERDYLNDIHWTLEKSDGTMLTVVPCYTDCTGDLPPEFFGTLESFSAQPQTGPIINTPVIVRTQTQ